MINGNDLEERSGVTMVEVTAQVMEYDESVGGCGGWIPLDGGGMSLVTLQQIVTGVTGQLASAAATTPLNQTGRPATAESFADPTENPARQQLISEVLVRCEYLILGRRLDDRKVLLHCTVCKDTTYRLMSPYLHTCTMGNKRFGLCFQSSYEACLFQKQFQKAIEHLYSQSKSSSGESNLDAEELEDEVFMPVDLPVSRDNSEALSTAKGVGYIRGIRCNGAPSTLLAETQFSTVGMGGDVPSPSVELYPGQGGNTYPYVIFQPESLKTTSAAAPLGAYGKPPTVPLAGRRFGSPPSTSVAFKSYQLDPSYHYPMLGEEKLMSGAHPPKRFGSGPPRPNNFGLPARSHGYPPLSRRETSPITTAPSRYGSQAGEKRESVGSLKLPSYVHHTPVPLPSASGKDIIARAQCFYCKIWFRTDQNERGACAEAPDVCDLWLQRATCLWCANCAVYCCLREDGEGPAQRGSHVCACDSEDSNCCARWTIMGLLSLVVPCLWCYLPLKACHLCCRSCSMCGGRHRAI